MPSFLYTRPRRFEKFRNPWFFLKIHYSCFNMEESKKKALCTYRHEENLPSCPCTEYKQYFFLYLDEYSFILPVTEKDSIDELIKTYSIKTDCSLIRYIYVIKENKISEILKVTQTKHIACGYFSKTRRQSTTGYYRITAWKKISKHSGQTKFLGKEIGSHKRIQNNYSMFIPCYDMIKIVLTQYKKKFKNF